jgi:hypothetical protein
MVTRPPCWAYSMATRLTVLCINRQVAADTRVSESVMMTNYVQETDEEMRQRSNRTYRRISVAMYDGQLEIITTTIRARLCVEVRSSRTAPGSSL